MSREAIVIGQSCETLYNQGLFSLLTFSFLSDAGGSNQYMFPKSLPILHGGPDFLSVGIPQAASSSESAPASSGRFIRFSAEVLSANLLIHSPPLCQPLAGRGSLPAYFCAAGRELCGLL